MSRQLIQQTTIKQFIFLIVLGAVTACAADVPRVELKGETFTVEVVSRLEDQILGMMYRESNPNDHGMLFVYTREEPRSFWMKNTRIPLDIMYFDAEYRLINAHFQVQPCRRDPCESYPSTADAQYVLELNGGIAEKLGVEAGDVMTVSY